MNLLSATLTDRFISITGPDTIKFLQGQASCDLNELSEGNFLYGTLNTPKGRMYCIFKVVKTDDGLLLSMNEGVLEPTLQKLSKYAAFFKCELKETTSFSALGITSDDNASFRAFLKSKHVDQTVIRAAKPDQNQSFCLNISSQNRLAEIWVLKDSKPENTLSNCKTISAEQWLALETATGIPELYESSQEEFILQSLNLHHLGAVSFKKGCYTGQEIIARMKFLGKQKKQAYLLHSKDECTQAPLAPVYDKEGTKRGILIRSHWSENTGSYALCILSIEAALSYESIYLNESLKTPFTVSEINYSEFNI